MQIVDEVVRLQADITTANPSMVDRGARQSGHPLGGPMTLWVKQTRQRTLLTVSGWRAQIWQWEGYGPLHMKSC